MFVAKESAPALIGKPEFVPPASVYLGNWIVGKTCLGGIDCGDGFDNVYPASSPVRFVPMVASVGNAVFVY